MSANVISTGGMLVFISGDIGKNRGRLSNQFISSARSPIRVPRTLSTFHPLGQRYAFRRRDVHLQSRSVLPLISIAEIQPQLQPALLRLSAISSQSRFTGFYCKRDAVVI